MCADLNSARQFVSLLFMPGQFLSPLVMLPGGSAAHFSRTPTE